MTRIGFTLIELLIVVAIVAILSAGFVFSATQIMTRTVVVQHVMWSEQALGLTLEAISADVAQSASHEVEAQILRLALPPTPDGVAQTVVYRIADGCLTREVPLGDARVAMALIPDSASGEFIDDGGGLSLHLISGIHRWRADIDRRADTFIAWPQAVGGGAP